MSLWCHRTPTYCTRTYVPSSVGRVHDSSDPRYTCAKHTAGLRPSAATPPVPFHSILSYPVPPIPTSDRNAPLCTSGCPFRCSTTTPSTPTTESYYTSNEGVSASDIEIFDPTYGIREEAPTSVPSLVRSKAPQPGGSSTGQRIGVGN